jgi:hypothetical protein
LASVLIVTGTRAGVPKVKDDRDANSSVRAFRQVVGECNRKAIADFKKGAMLAVARGYADDATIYFPQGKKVHNRKTIDR